MDIGEAADELYALPPERFTARRAELATQAKAEGERDVAARIGRLRRPTVSAWCVNVLVAEQDSALVELLEVASDLRRAQADLDAARMAELSGRRRALVRGVQQAAAAVATQQGQSLSAAAQREVEETMAAAVASAEAAEAVASGWLTRALSYAGFGEVDLEEATAAPRPAGREPVKREQARQRSTDGTTSRPRLRLVETPQTQPPAQRPAQRPAAPDPAEQLALAVRQARAAVEEAASAVVQAQARADELAGTARRLQEELSAARAAAASATRDAATAERRHASATVALSNAQRRLRSATKGRARS